MGFDTFIIDNMTDFNLFRDLWKDIPNSYVVLDLETNSSSEKLAKIYGIGLSLREGESFYIPVRNNKKELLWTPAQLAGIYGHIDELIAMNGVSGWNVLYDCLVWENNGGRRISQFIKSDGMLLKHLVDEMRPFALKEVAVKILGPWADKAQKEMFDSIEKNGGKHTQDQMDIWIADTEILAEYCNWDCILTRKLIDHYQKQVDEQGLNKLLEEEVMPLYQVTIEMKRRGFPINVKYFQQLHEDIALEINKLEDQTLDEIKEHISSYEEKILNEEFPCKRTGNFPKALAKRRSFKLPEKDGKISIAKKEVEKLLENEENHEDAGFYKWLLGDDSLTPAQKTILATQKAMFFEKYPDQKYVFNLASNSDLGWLFFTHLGLKPLSKTEGGKPQCDDDFLDSIKDKLPFVAKLTDLRQLRKLDSTYILGVLERHIDGVVYSSFLQHGTTSGRYSSTNPNLQNLPREKDDEANLSVLVLKYVNSIKRGFVAPKGYKIVNADFSQLEPCCFAHASGDESLRDVFRNNLDLYAQIAIDVFGLADVSADKKSPKYLKHTHPEKRQLVKIFALAVPYGAEAGRISGEMDVSYVEAENLIEDYLDAYPDLRKYMADCNYKAKKDGLIHSEFGRIRHLPQAKGLYERYGDKLLNRKYAKSQGLSETRYIYKNALNLSSNFPIQSLASHIVNRAMIKAQAEFKRQKVDAWIAANVHDEITCMAAEKDAEKVKNILRDAMENTTKISVPLKAEPIIGNNWLEAK